MEQSMKDDQLSRSMRKRRSREGTRHAGWAKYRAKGCVSRPTGSKVRSGGGGAEERQAARWVEERNNSPDLPNQAHRASFVDPLRPRHHRITATTQSDTSKRRTERQVVIDISKPSGPILHSGRVEGPSQNQPRGPLLRRRRNDWRSRRQAAR